MVGSTPFFILVTFKGILQGLVYPEALGQGVGGGSCFRTEKPQIIKEKTHLRVCVSVQPSPIQTPHQPPSPPLEVLYPGSPRIGIGGSWGIFEDSPRHVGGQRP